MNKRLFLPLTCLLALSGCGESDGDTSTTNADTSSGSGTEDGTATTDSSSEAGTMDASSGDGDASSSGDGDASSTGDGDGDSSSTGDGDGDSSSTGDGDGDSSSTGDGDGDTTGDGDGDTTGDGDGDSGTTGSNPDDDDMDGIPNDDDPFPNDPDSPGVGIPNVVYAHTSSALFTMNVVTYEVQQVGNFTFDSDAGQITDIALDRWGVLYAVSFNDVFVCDATTAACTHLGDLPQQFNGLTMVPPGAIDVGDDTLVGIANSGAWYRIDAANGQATVSQIGSYGGGYTNSGDVFSIQGVGTYGAVDAGAADQIVVADPATGAVQSVLATTTGYSTLYGLAGWNGAIFGFNSGGEIIDIDPSTGAVTELADTPYVWWGAGVFSVLPE